MFQPNSLRGYTQQMMHSEMGNTHDMRAQRVDVKNIKATHMSRRKERYFFETE